MNFKQALADAVKQGSVRDGRADHAQRVHRPGRERPAIAATAHQRSFEMVRAAGLSPTGLHAGEVSYDVLRKRAVRARRAARARRALLRDGGPGSRDAAADPAAVGAARRRQELGRRAAQAGAGGVDAAPRTARSTRCRAARCTRSRCIWSRTRCARRRASTRACRWRAGCARSAAWRLEHEFDGDFLQLPDRARSYFSEARRVGIGTFEPGDPKSMSMEQLTGGLDFRAIETHGSDSHPLALDWAGEFSKSNRGAVRGRRVLQEPRRVPQPVPDDGAGEAVQGRQVRLHRLRHGDPRRTPTRPSSARSWPTRRTRR